MEVPNPEQQFRCALLSCTLKLKDCVRRRRKADAGDRVYASCASKCGCAQGGRNGEAVGDLVPAEQLLTSTQRWGAAAYPARPKPSPKFPLPPRIDARSATAPKEDEVSKSEFEERDVKLSAVDEVVKRAKKPRTRHVNANIIAFRASDEELAYMKEAFGELNNSQYSYNATISAAERILKRPRPQRSVNAPKRDDLQDAAKKLGLTKKELKKKLLDAAVATLLAPKAATPGERFDAPRGGT